MLNPASRSTGELPSEEANEDASSSSGEPVPSLASSLLRRSRSTSALKSAEHMASASTTSLASSARPCSSQCKYRRLSTLNIEMSSGSHASSRSSMGLSSPEVEARARGPICNGDEGSASVAHQASA
eukprot:2709393-Pleurochrysis_carterae.AAC.1